MLPALLLDIAPEVPQHFCGFGDRRSWISLRRLLKDDNTICH
jgi:hypothetical protein